jgi:hypothetical protein
VNTGRKVRQEYWPPRIVFNLYSVYLTKEALEEFGNFKTRQVIRSVKYAHELVLQAKEEMALQSMTDRLNKVGRRYGMEMNYGDSTLNYTVNRNNNLFLAAEI